MTKTNPKFRILNYASLLLVLFFASFGLKGTAQPLLVDNFDYTIGTNLTDNGWTAHSGGGTQPITVTDGLSYTGYSGSGVGGAALVDNNGEDDSKTMTAVTSGTLYLAALINVQNAAAGYFYHLGGSTSLFAARVFVRASSTSGKINFGFSNTSTATYSTADFDPGTTYLVIIKYDVSATGDGSMWVVASGVPASEVDAGTPLLTATGTGLASIDRVCLRQYSATQNILVDAIRLATTWGDAVTPTGVVSPDIAVTPAILSDFNYTEGSGPSADQSFSVSGSDLTDDVTLTAPADYEISLTSGSGYTSPIVLTQTAGTLDPTTVYVRLKAGLAAGTYNGETINLTSTGATTKTVTCNGSVTALTPQLAAVPTTLSGFTYAVDAGGPSPSNYFSLSGIYLTGFPGVITVTGSTNYEVSFDDATYGTTAEVPFTAATLDAVPVFIRLKAGLAQGTYNGEPVVCSGGGAPSITITCNGSVTAPQPTASVTARPLYMDLSSTTTESAVLMTVSNYASDDARYRLYSGSYYYYCWDAATSAYIASSAYNLGPSIPGTPSTSSTFWILFQRGTNNSVDASYRDRLGPSYGSNYQTVSLPSITAMSTTFQLSGFFVPTGGYDNSVKHVILGYSGTDLICATSNALSTGAFSLTCPDGVTIDKIEVRAVDNTYIADITGTWTTTTNVGNIPAGGTSPVTTPEINPGTGNYYSSFDATITCSTPGASVYYTTDGTDPNNTGNGTLYTVPVTITGTSTLKAIAYAAGFDPSAIATAVYTFPVITDVPDIATLRAGLQDGTIYRLTGEAVLTMQATSGHVKYIQDATGAIFIYDGPAVITTTYNIYDGITGITGSLALYNGMLEFIPVEDPGTATSTGNTVTPEEVSLAGLNSTYQAKLVKILNTTIGATGQFAAGTNYTLTDPSGSGVLRTQYSELDYIGTDIPQTPQDISAVILEYNGVYQVIPRSLADFSTSAGAIITATPNTLTGFVYGAGNGPSASQSYVLEGSSLSGYPGNITVTGSSSFEVSADDITFSGSINVPFTSSTLGATTVYVRLKSGLVSGEYNSEVISNDGGGILLPVNVTVSGTVLAGEPTNHATSFAATAPDYSTITVTWDDNDGAQPADGFLILANTTGSFAAPVDGIAQTNDLVLADGSGVANVAHGVETFSWSGLNPETTYYFTIYPFTNAGTLIDYKTDGTVPETDATTPAAAEPLATWTFDATPAAPNTPTSIAANYGTQLTAMFYADGTNGSDLWLSSASNPELTTFGGSTLNDPRPTPLAGNAITLANSAANGKSVVFKFSMTGYENPVLSFATRGTSTGFNMHQWAWSTDNVTYTDFGTNTVTNTSTWVSRSLDMSSIDALDQAAEVYIRLTVSGATAAAGNNRLDNIVLNATETGSTSKTLNLSVFLESLYSGAGTMRKAQSDAGDQFPGTVADQVTIELHDGGNYGSVVQTISNVDLNQDGSLSAAVPSESNGSYYITIVHRNSIATTTAVPVSFADATVTYAFDAAAKAYGSNLLDMGDGYFAIYGGDVNQDGSVDTGDITPLDNDQFNFATGYVATDVNGDGTVDTGDITIVDNNQFNFVGSVLPF